MGRWSEEREESVDVALFVLGGATERAVRVRLPEELKDDQGAWLPWSQVEALRDEDGPIDPDDVETHTTITAAPSRWLAEDRGWA